MDYNSALEFVYSRRKFEKSSGFERLSALLSLLGSPQNRLKFVHVAGTNGKGSVSAMLAFALRRAGYKTGLFTSPFVVDFCERIQVDNRYIEHEDFARIAEEVKRACLQIEKDGLCPTFFETVFAAALLHFERSGCDIAVLEAGIGGLSDSTNIIPAPEAAVLVSVSLDHTEVLGNTAEEIAEKKSGIIKPGSGVVSFPKSCGGLDFVPQKQSVWNIFADVSKKNDCDFHSPDMEKVKNVREDITGTDFEFDGLRLHIGFLGAHQIANAAVAVTALRVLQKRGFGVTDGDIEAGLAEAFVPARMEIVSDNPPVILDGGHNEGCMRALCAALKKHAGKRRITALLAFMKDKDYETAIGLIAPLCENIIFTTAEKCRGESPFVLMKKAEGLCKNVFAVEDVQEAFLAAEKKAGADGLLIAAGSFYLVSEIRKNFDV